MALYGNYKYSLTGEQQSAIQVWLRMLPVELRNGKVWEILHDLTYAESWTEKPEFKTLEPDLNIGDALFEVLNKIAK